MIMLMPPTILVRPLRICRCQQGFIDQVGSEPISAVIFAEWLMDPLFRRCKSGEGFTCGGRRGHQPGTVLPPHKKLYGRDKECDPELFPTPT